ncbi:MULTISPECIES: hypothetical protein [Acinetobacter]|uniref:Uncharacterized protein n=2 Tax=Acinetobacter haemolyticus TaxID=29430 RepID=A0A1L6KLH5_ACIHA|nr:MULTISPECIES: hypothetical protein [Acinetobacter]APR69903.1 hypothetical protein AHTJS_05550 [Acinetobacter haemolyticus]AZN68610.1 hypothetical protein DX910_10435 [Acinetobacter haemolyticus]EEH70268.1 hypothetical protein HMPREF0023_0193 [Acinetobacter sp. ATCC 27244]ENW15576.1 hypothetical protein F927_03315 [Acinetobacter haemolyticus CIP 64.3 = MTCC 9819]ENW20705.1 hypothetical protein F926_01478 [Acinetobacter haemolyticus NIPH 261]
MNIGKEDFYFSILEQKIENKFLFPIKININGLCFGTFDSPTYMPSFIASLKSLIENKYLLNNELNKINFLDKIFINNDFIDNYYFTLEETFDDFSKRAARNDRFVFFLFQLHEDPFFTYPNLDVGRVYAESVPIDSVKFAVKELIKYRNQYF